MRSQHHDPQALEEVPRRDCGQQLLLTTATITTLEGFRQLRPEWSELLGACTGGRFFLTWEWLHTWWTHLADDRTLYIITVRHEERLVAIVPLASRPGRYLRLMPFRALEFLGCGNVGSDYLNILVRSGYEEAANRVIAACLTERNMPLQLSQIERVLPQMVQLTMQLRLLGWYPHRTTINYCPYINLTGHDWRSYLASLGTSHRTNFRRRLKKLTTGFNMRIEQAVTDAQRSEALSILVALHLQRWHSRGGSNALHRDALVAFHDDVSNTALQLGWLRLFVMWLDDVPVAALYGFVYNNTFYFYQSGFDINYSQYSVGLVMMGLVIKNTIEEGLREFDFLHGEESYKYLWAWQEREQVRYDLFPPQAYGFFCSLFMQLREKLKRLVWQWLAAHPGKRTTRSSRIRLQWDATKGKQ